MALGTKNTNSTLMKQSRTLMDVQDVSQAYAGAAALRGADAVLVVAGEVRSRGLEALLRETEALPVHQEGLHCLAWPQEAQKHLHNSMHMTEHFQRYLKKTLMLIHYLQTSSPVFILCPQQISTSLLTHSTLLTYININ
jgi:hypothetical protein